MRLICLGAKAIENQALKLHAGICSSIEKYFPHAFPIPPMYFLKTLRDPD